VFTRTSVELSQNRWFFAIKLSLTCTFSFRRIAQLMTDESRPPVVPISTSLEYCSHRFFSPSGQSKSKIVAVTDEFSSEPCLEYIQQTQRSGQEDPRHLLFARECLLLSQLYKTIRRKATLLANKRRERTATATDSCPSPIATPLFQRTKHSPLPGRAEGKIGSRSLLGSQ